MIQERGGRICFTPVSGLHKPSVGSSLRESLRESERRSIRKSDGARKLPGDTSGQRGTDRQVKAALRSGVRAFGRSGSIAPRSLQCGPGPTGRALGPDRPSVAPRFARPARGIPPCRAINRGAHSPARPAVLPLPAALSLVTTTRRQCMALDPQPSPVPPWPYPRPGALDRESPVSCGDWPH